MPASLPFAWTYEDHRRRQIRRGLELSAAERLRWLETTMEEMRALLGRARPEPSGPAGRVPRGAA